MSRVTQILLSLAAVMVIGIGALIILSMFGNPFRRVTDSALPVPAATGAAQVEPVQPTYRLRGFSDLGGGLMRAPLVAAWSGRQGYYDKEVSNAPVNLLYSGPDGERWLYPANAQLLTMVEDIAPAPGAAPTATLVQVVDADRDGNGTLSPADGSRLILMRADGTGPQQLAEGLTEGASVSPGASRWIVGWTDAQGQRLLSDIDPSTGTAAPPRPLSLPKVP